MSQLITPPWECWLSVPGYEGYYEASDCGRVRSVDRIIYDKNGFPKRLRGCVLIPTMDGHGRLKVVLSANGVHVNKRVHKLVMLTFKGPTPIGLEVCHNDGNASHNWLGNLRWDTHLENNRDMLRHGTHNEASKIACKWGHLFSGRNLQVKLSKIGVPRRRCRSCDLADSFWRKARQRGLVYDKRQLADEYYEKFARGAA